MKKVLTSVILLAILGVMMWGGNELYQTNKKLEEATGEIKTITQQSLSFQESLEKSEAEKQELEKSVENLLNDKHNLEEQNKNLEASNESLSSSNGTLSEVNEELKQEILRLKAELKK